MQIGNKFQGCCHCRKKVWLSLLPPLEKVLLQTLSSTSCTLRHSASGHPSSFYCFDQHEAFFIHEICTPFVCLWGEELTGLSTARVTRFKQRWQYDTDTVSREEWMQRVNAGTPYASAYSHTVTRSHQCRIGLANPVKNAHTHTVVGWPSKHSLALPLVHKDHFWLALCVCAF